MEDRKAGIIAAAEEFKVKGNEYFAKQDYETAADYYTQAIDACVDEETLEIVEDNIHIYYSNRAFCKLKLELFGSCIMDASEAIKNKPGYAKSYFRRGCAHEALGKLKLAKDDFTRCLKLEPSNKDAAERLKDVEKLLKQQRFLAAIATEVKKLMTSIDENSLAVPSGYTGPVYESGVSGLAFCEELKQWFLKGNNLPEKYAYKIVMDAWKSFKDLPPVVDVRIEKGKKFTMCGDVHGQFNDFLEIFKKNGNPSKENPYLFNGDIVDRGNKSTECLLLILAYRVCEPGCMYVNRGNHETKSMNSLYGFSTECRQKVNLRFYELCSELFQSIPLVHLLNRRVFVTHGGLFCNDGVTINDLMKINRFDEPGQEGHFVDLLWSDPHPYPGRIPSPRGVGMKFGPDVTARFLKDNNLDLVLRSHEMEIEGYKAYHSNTCYTVFSAPNYCGVMNNKGAYCVLECTGEPEGERGGSLKPNFKQFETASIGNK